jgi:hypothetical protein
MMAQKRPKNLGDDDDDYNANCVHFVVLILGNV